MKAEVSVYSELVDDLRSRIASGEYKLGERIPGENELAARFGISRTSVRKGIRLLIDEELLVSRQGQGAFVTRPAELRSCRVLRVGLFARPFCPGSETYLMIQNILCERFSAGGCRVELLAMPDSSEAFLNNHIESLDCYVWIAPANSSFEIIKDLAARIAKPFFLYDRMLDGASGNVVWGAHNEKDAMRQAVNLLSNYGLKKVLFMHRGQEQYNVRRVKLFKDSVASASNIVFSPDMIVDVCDCSTSAAKYAKNVSEHIAKAKPDAVFFSQGAICSEILQCLYAMGVKIPEDLSVITFDKVESLYDIEITHIFSDAEKLAALSADYIVKSLRNPDSKILPPVLKSMLVMGDSCCFLK